jgi:hypothetical protein
MLVPQAYDLAWTQLEQVFNLTLSPGEVAAITGSTSPESLAAANEAIAEVAQGEITNFPSAPNSVADRPYSNPIACTQTPLGAGSNGQILPANKVRTLLIIQNNSNTGDATFWIAFGQPAVPDECIGLTPGQSLTLDAACPRDSVNINVAGAAGNTFGVIVEGSYLAQPPPTSGVNVGAEAWGYTSSGSAGGAGEA